MKPRVIILAAFFITLGIVAIGLATLRQLDRDEPYPGFMARIQPTRPYSYPDLIRTFDEFVAEQFPTGSSAKAAIEQITRGNLFVPAPSSGDEKRFIWTRSAGICNERYFIAIRENALGQITAIKGELHPICL